MKQEQLDLYRILLKSVAPLTLSRVAWVIGDSSERLHARVLALGQVLAYLNKAIENMDTNEIFHQLTSPDLVAIDELHNSLAFYEDLILEYCDNLYLVSCFATIQLP